MNILFSRNLAIFIGVITPLLETIRRWSTWQDDPMSFFDDYIIGGLLLYGAWRVGKNAREGQKYLVAGWGFAMGMVYASLNFQLQQLRVGAVDPAPISSEWVAVIKGIGFVLVFLGLVSSLRRINN
jgi:hypothetical protein